jgi:DMSO/TMAO reductase YedYZ molybdopterin-dependent catalytic subunit
MSLSRRRFLELSALAAGGTLAGCRDRRTAETLMAVGRANATVEAAMFRHTAMNHPAAGATTSGLAFPQYYVSPAPPEWDEARQGPWYLEVVGAVRRPLRLSLGDLMAMRNTAQKVDHFCVEGWNARAVWRGVRLADLARMAELTPDAGFVDFVSFDSGYHESWDIDSALHPQTLIATVKDGAYLGAGYGGPARVHSPVKLGYKNTKYLTKIVFQPAANGGYWSDRGYEWYGGT